MSIVRFLRIRGLPVVQVPIHHYIIIIRLAKVMEPIVIVLAIPREGGNEGGIGVKLTPEGVGSREGG